MPSEIGAYIVPRGARRAGHLPHHHRHRGDGLGPGRGRAARRRSSGVLRPIRSRRPRRCCTRWPACKQYDVITFQAEDEIAAACAAIGASYAGALGVTSSSGPGIALKTEAIGLAIVDRAAAGHRQLAARRAVDRPAHQDRAVGSVSGGVRPQRRQPGRRRSPPARRATASRSASRRCASPPNT